MKKIIAIILMCLMIFAAHAESVPNNIPDDGIVDFDGLFTLQFPENWQSYATDEAQAAEGIFIMFGDGETFMTIAKAENTGEYADTAAYCQHLQETKWPNAFLTTFGGTEDEPGVDDADAIPGTDFVLYNDLDAGKAMCAVVIPGSGIYTFTFSPIAADMEAGQLILDLMESYTPTVAE